MGSCLGLWRRKERREAYQAPLPVSVLQFYMDRAARAEPGSAGIGGVLQSSKGEVLLLFSKNVGVRT